MMVKKLVFPFLLILVFAYQVYAADASVVVDTNGMSVGAESEASSDGANAWEEISGEMQEDTGMGLVDAGEDGGQESPVTEAGAEKDGAEAVETGTGTENGSETNTNDGDAWYRLSLQDIVVQLLGGLLLIFLPGCCIYWRAKR